ncbi:hypothetical protein QTI17_30105 [Variovorax sp. J31P179]|uniref:hypothetical protein n=1 Tax=Variovorax sp. J31P179 TaxID=3053508 RepID=UPI002575D9E4|nr:hypothetical protein [Variovorax sp. J31P179]MDM0084860.1 hypothetical protein [Variovorax sp. J31P179]
MPNHKLLTRTALLKEERTRQPTEADSLGEGNDEVANDIGTDKQSHLASERSKEGAHNEAPLSRNETLATVEPSIPLEESAGKRFRQNAAIAFIFGLAALTLVLIVHLHP